MKIGKSNLISCTAQTDRDATICEITQALVVAAHMKRNAHFWLGELLVEMEKKAGTKMWNYIHLEDLGFKTSEINRLMKVAEEVPAKNRLPDLSWSHHAVVSRLPSHMQKDALEKARNLGLTSGETRSLVNEMISKHKKYEY